MRKRANERERKRDWEGEGVNQRGKRRERKREKESGCKTGGGSVRTATWTRPYRARSPALTPLTGSTPSYGILRASAPRERGGPRRGSSSSARPVAKDHCRRGVVLVSSLFPSHVVAREKDRAQCSMRSRIRDTASRNISFIRSGIGLSQARRPRGGKESQDFTREVAIAFARPSRARARARTSG